MAIGANPMSHIFLQTKSLNKSFMRRVSKQMAPTWLTNQLI